MNRYENLTLNFYHDTVRDTDDSSEIYMYLLSFDDHILCLVLSV